MKRLVPVILVSLACGDDGPAGGGSDDTAGTSTSTTSTTLPSTSTSSTTTGVESTSTDGSTSTGSSSTSEATSSSSGSSSSSGGMVIGPQYDCSPPEGEIPALELEPWFAMKGWMPSGMAIDPQDPDRLYITELTGQVHVVQDGVMLPGLFLDLSDGELYCCSNDTGFGGLAMHPDYADNGLFYVHHTTSETETRLAEYHRSDADPDVADPDPVRELLTIGQTDVWHYGGSIQFGSDGLLYYSRGDGGGVGDPESDAQNPLSQLGKVLRLDVDAFPDPPLGNMPDADPFVWAMGLRNTWRMSFDPCTDDLYLADVGQNWVEEVSVLPAGEEHLDFGWNTFEGNDCYEGPCDDLTPFTFPVTTYNHVDGMCAVIGGHVYRGTAIPALRGRYFYGDICSKRIFSFRYEDGVAADPLEHSLDLDSTLLLGDYSFVSFGQDAYGELYVFDTTGAIWRIVAR